MAWVTALGPNMAQVEYRLSHDAGCAVTADPADLADGQVAYRLDGEIPLEWIGGGLPDVGIQPGTQMTEEQKAWARALMSGKHPHTGEQLVQPKKAADPRAKLAVRPLLDAIDAAAAVLDTTIGQLLDDPAMRKDYARLQRGVTRNGDSHRAAISRLQHLATVAGVDLAAVYDAGELALARQHANDRVIIGNRGYDLTLDISKSVSVLYAMADEVTARQLENVYLDAVRQTVTAMQGWAAYGMRGHHGDGQQARRIAASGVLGWMMVHRTARPVAGAAPDPHLHVHVTLANMVHGEDGQWSTVGAGGRDIHRHAHAADAFLKARMRAETTRRWGIAWRRDSVTGAWEISAIPERLRAQFSKRSTQVEQTLQRLGLDADTATVAQAKDAAARSREAKQPPGAGGDLRADWQAQARAAGVEPAELVTAAMPGTGQQPGNPSATEIAEWIFRDGQDLVAKLFERGALPANGSAGLTENRKTITRAEVLAAVMDALPFGLESIEEAEALTDEVLAVPGFAVQLPTSAPAHLSNNARFTTEDIVAAERRVLAAARAGFAANIGVVHTRTAELALGQFEATAGFELSDEQRRVLRRLLHTGHGVDAVVGVAGSGKTTLMAALRAAYEAEGLKVAGAANAAVAAANLQAESGIPSATVAGWLLRIDNGRGMTGIDVLVVDEAATVDDRQLARLLAYAQERSIKVIGIGDPKQLRAPGVGGAFAAVHELVGGLTLHDNRRQRSEAERAALNLWRTGALHEALNAWAAASRVHAVATAADAHAQMLARWEHTRQRWNDPYDRIERLLVMAGSNEDVDRLNDGAQAIRVAAGELDANRARPFVRRGGSRITLLPGDQVLIRLNQRRPDGPDLLNGYRGVITRIDGRGHVEVQWRTMTADGPQLQETSVSPDYIAHGGLTLGYALTVAKAQGLTADYAVTYGAGLDPHTLYPGMTRARQENHLILPVTLLENEATQARLGPPRTPGEELDRAVAAYAQRLLEADHDDGLVLGELEDVDLSPLNLPTTAPSQKVPPPVGVRLAARAAEQEHAGRKSPWRIRPHGHLTDAQLMRAIIDAERRAAVARAASAEAAQRANDRQQAAATGQGPAARLLREQRQQLAKAAAAQTEADVREQAVKQARARAAHLDDDLSRPAVVRAMRGINTAVARAERNRQLASAERARQAESIARTTAAHHAAAAGLPAGQDPAVALADLQQRWIELSRTAIDEDVANAAARSFPESVPAPADGPDLAELRQEQEVRQRLDSVAAQAERRDRDRELTERARREADATRHVVEPEREPEPGL